MVDAAAVDVLGSACDGDDVDGVVVGGDVGCCWIVDKGKAVASCFNKFPLFVNEEIAKCLSHKV